MRDHLRPDLDELLPQRRKRPVLHRSRQCQPTQEVALVVGQHEELKPYLVIHEVVATQPRPLHRILALLDPLFRRAAMVVEPYDPPWRPTQVRHDEAHPREQLSLVVLDLRHHPTRSRPALGLVQEIIVPDDRFIRRTAYRAGQQRLDLSL